MIEFEMCLWNALEVLSQVENAGVFLGKLGDARKLVESLAKEVREYNDQFEDEND